MRCLIQGPGFPLTRKNRVLGFSESLIIIVLISFLATWMGLDSVEFWHWLDFLKEFDVPVAVS